MSKTRIKSFLEKTRGYKTEIAVGVSISAPFFIIVLVAFIKNDFTLFDHTYWVGVITYNGAALLGVWFTLRKRIIQLNRLILYYGVILSLIILFIFRDIAFAGDITLGVIDAAQLLWNGQNPYIVEGVRHAQPIPPGTFRYTTYPYLPVDLIVYSLFLGIMNLISTLIAGPNIPDYLPGFNAMGIFLSNFAFMLISIYLIWKILDSDIKFAISLSLFFFIILIWNNICLAQMLFFAGWFFHKRGQREMTIAFWSLSMLAKYFAGIFIVAYIVEDLRLKNFKTSFINGLIPVILTLVVFLPFGIFETLKSTVFFYNTEERLLDGSFGGSLVSELVLFLQLETVVWIFTLAGFAIILVICFLIKDQYERLVVSSLLALLVLSGISAQFFPMILFILIVAERVKFNIDGEKISIEKRSTNLPNS